ncbi:PAS domain S-box protein, partial [bacterium]
ASALAHRDDLLVALARSEARHRRIVERSQDVIFEMDLNGRWVFLSSAWTRLTGRGIDQCLGQRALSAVLRDDRRKLVAAEAAARHAPGSIEQTEVRFVGCIGVHWAAVSIASLYDDAGELIGSHGTLSDITERRFAAEELTERERRYRLLADNTSDMIATIDLAGRFLTVSPAATPLLGFKPETLQDSAILSVVVASDQRIVREACTALMKGAPDQTISFRALRRDDEPVWVEGAFRLLRDDAGRPVEYIVSVRDIARRKLLEAQAATALAQVRESNRLFSMAGALASIGHWRWDTRTDVLLWSDEMFRIFGVDPTITPTLDAAMDLYHPEDRDLVAAAIARSRAEDRDLAFAARLMRTDGSIRHVVASGKVERDETGTVIGLFGVYQDVSDRAHAEQTLRDSEARFRLITEQASDV